MIHTSTLMKCWWGCVRRNPEIYRQTGEGGRVITRAGSPKTWEGWYRLRVWFGHLPVFTGYVGHGLLDACAIGDVFASPSVEQMAEAMKVAHAGAGVFVKFLWKLWWRCHELRYGWRATRDGGRYSIHNCSSRR